MGEKKIGPKVKALIIHKFSRDAIPGGGGLASALGVLTNPGALSDGMRQAQEWVLEAIQMVKVAPNNPYGDDDEAIAKAILEKIPGICPECGRGMTNLGQHGMKCLSCLKESKP